MLVVQASYGESVDIWAVGVIMYMLLAGEPPFPGVLDDDVFEAVMHRPPDLYEGPWVDISQGAKVTPPCPHSRLNLHLQCTSAARAQCTSKT